MSGEAPLLLASARVVDGVGDLGAVHRLRTALEQGGRTVISLRIAALDHPWDAPPDPRGRLFKSGCAPILALHRARELLASGDADAVLVRGREPLRTGYERSARQAHMAIWPGRSIPEAYTELAEVWMARHGMQAPAFRRLADGLLDNYRATAHERGLAGDVDTAQHRARQRVATRLFTYADCAHPEIDFEGAVLLARADVGRELLPPGRPVIRLLGVAVDTVPDGPEHRETIAQYAHLRRAYLRAEAEAGVDFGAAFHAGDALLEAYTCFPVVPLGFLLATALAPDPAALAPLLEAHAVTVTGGMNLARAPWNNPVLNALTVMHQRLAAGEAPVGLLHGNGGLGGWQGVAVIGA